MFGEIFIMLQQQSISTVVCYDAVKCIFSPVCLGHCHSVYKFNLIACVFSAIVSSRPATDNSPQKMYAIMSFSYLGAMLCSNHALQFISYPTQV